MKRSKPPALATWLLENTRFGTTDGVIGGDLLEEFNRGRSAAWYWRQVLVAIIVGYANEARHHSLLAARAILITLVANYGALMLGREVMLDLFRHRLLTYHPRTTGILFGLAMWAFCFLGGIASGLIVSLLHRRQRNAMLLTGAAALLGWALMAIVFLKTGSRQHSVLQIAGAALVYYLVALAGFAIGGFLLTPAPTPVPTASE